MAYLGMLPKAHVESELLQPRLFTQYNARHGYLKSNIGKTWSSCNFRLFRHSAFNKTSPQVGGLAVPSRRLLVGMSHPEKLDLAEGFS